MNCDDEYLQFDLELKGYLPLEATKPFLEPRRIEPPKLTTPRADRWTEDTFAPGWPEAPTIRFGPWEVSARREKQELVLHIEFANSGGRGVFITTPSGDDPVFSVGLRDRTINWNATLARVRGLREPGAAINVQEVARQSSLGGLQGFTRSEDRKSVV